MTETHAPTDVVARAFVVKRDGLPDVIALADSLEEVEASYDSEDVEISSATRADLEEHGLEMAEDGSIAPKVVDQGAPDEVAPVVEGPADEVEAAPAPAKKRRRGTVTDRARREEAEAKPASSDG